MKILLGDQTYQGRSKGATGQRLVNLYAEPNPEGSKFPYTLYPTQGLVEWCDLGTAKGIQGMQKMGSLLYAVSGNEVFKIDTDGNSTSLGSITGTEDRVDLANNGTQLGILNPDGDLWYATSSALTQVVDGDYPSSSSITFMDGYLITSVLSSGQFNLSGLYDMSSYDALDYATAEERPDNLVRVFAFNNALWLFGEDSYEVYYNSGNADFPFEQISGAVNTTRGLGAKFTVIEDDNSLFFLGDDRIFYRLDGYTPQRISTHAIEYALSTYSVISDAYGFVTELDGHKFLNFTFPSENKTLSHDVATGLWHERTSLEGGYPKRWRASCSEKFAGKALVGDAANGKIYELSSTTYTEDGETIERVVQGSVQSVDSKRVTYDWVRLDIDAGVGLTTGQGSDPQVMMRYSDDGLNTWSNELWRSFGAIGKYKAKPFWRRLGTARERVFEWRITDPVKTIISGAYAGGRIGTE